MKGYGGRRILKECLAYLCNNSVMLIESQGKKS